MNLLTHLHPAIVHFPIALLLVASASGLTYLFLWPRAELRPLTWAAALLGWVACAAAVASGLLAQAGLPPNAPYRSVLNWHIGAGLGALAVYGLLLYQAWIDRSARVRRTRLQAGLPEQRDYLDAPGGTRVMTAALLIAGALLVLFTGWNGGVLVYEWAVNVAQ
jgi:uncharacterized membrane protein